MYHKNISFPLDFLPHSIVVNTPPLSHFSFAIFCSRSSPLLSTNHLMILALYLCFSITSFFSTYTPYFSRIYFYSTFHSLHIRLSNLSAPAKRTRRLLYRYLIRNLTNHHSYNTSAFAQKNNKMLLQIKKSYFTTTNHTKDEMVSSGLKWLDVLIDLARIEILNDTDNEHAICFSLCNMFCVMQYVLRPPVILIQIPEVNFAFSFIFGIKERKFIAQYWNRFPWCILNTNVTIIENNNQ